MIKATCAECGQDRGLQGPRECGYCRSEDFEFSPQEVGHYLNSRTRGLNCQCCSVVLTGYYVQAYPHEDGWSLRGVTDKKFWLSIRCPACNYDNSFDKFGIKRG